VSRQLDEAKAYVENMRASGMPDNEIARALKGAGWREEQVQELLRRPEQADLLEASSTSPAAERGDRLSDPEEKGPAYRGSIPMSLDGAEQLRSPSGEWGLYSDLDEGRELLILSRNGQVQWQIPAGRGGWQDGAVTDTGYVVASTLPGGLTVFDSTGKQVLKKRLPTGIYCCGLSKDSALAWCITLRSPDNEAYSNKLVVFRLSPTKELIRTEEPYGEVSDVRLAESEVAVSVDLGVEYRYSLQGDLINEEELSEQLPRAAFNSALRASDGYSLFRWAARFGFAEVHRYVDQGELNTIRQLIERTAEAETSNNSKAVIYRGLGEIVVSCDEKRQALHFFRQALSLDPKVGVKKQLAALEKDLQGETS